MFVCLFILQGGMSLLMLVSSDMFALLNYMSFAQWLSVGASIAGLLYIRYRAWRGKPLLKQKVEDGPKIDPIEVSKMFSCKPPCRDFTGNCVPDPDKPITLVEKRVKCLCLLPIFHDHI